MVLLVRFFFVLEFGTTGFSYAGVCLDFFDVAKWALVKRTNRVEDPHPVQRLVGGRGHMVFPRAHLTTYLTSIVIFEIIY